MTESDNMIKPKEKAKNVIKLGGIWKGVKITDEDIKKARNSMLKELEKKF